MTRFAIILAAFGIVGGAARAAPITYTETAMATGMLGTTPFTSALVTLTLTGDTSNVTIPFSGIFLNAVGTGTVNIAGVGTATFTDQIEALVNQSASLGGLGDFTTTRLMLFAIDPGFTAYDLKSSFGPLSATAQGSGSGTFFATTLGNLEFSSVSGNATFTARTSSVPEPASMILLTTGLLGLAILRRKRS